MDTDHLVVLGKTHGVVYSLRDHSVIKLPREGNGFYLDMEVPAPEEEERQQQGADPGLASSFRRPEA